MGTILFKDGFPAFEGGVPTIIPVGGTPEDCTCCGPAECLCPDGTPQKTIASAVFVISGLPATYTEDQTSSTGGATNELTLSGFDALNGSYNLILASTATPVVIPDPCLEPSNECPLDRTTCRWSLSIPPVPITGTLQSSGSFNHTFTVTGHARLSFASAIPVIDIDLWLSPHPFTGTRGSNSARIQPSGMQTIGRSAGTPPTPVLLNRIGCDTTNISFHGLRADAELTSIVNAGFWKTDPEVLIGSVPDTKMYSRFGICGASVGKLFLQPDYSDVGVTPANVASGNVSISSCSLNGGNADAFSASYSLTINYN